LANELAHNTIPADLIHEKSVQNDKKAKATIMIVDDDPMVIDLLSEYLEDNTYFIIRASSGGEAVSKIKSARADIALVDLMMPGMDGLETIEQLAAIDPEMVMVLMTGFPTLDSSIKAIKLGASDYILKPFKLEDVNSSVAKAIKERETRQEMKNLQKRVFELEKRIQEKRDSIKVNQKVDIVSTPEGYMAKLPHSHNPETDTSK
jgi:DNA-binding NtrC family response regulator